MRKRSGRPPRFAAVPNETIDDSLNLDLTALGLLTVLLRHRDGWEITLAEIGEKYGYGRDALANAMGLLQVARYVVKVRYQSVDGNLWSTELYVYDTPATDAEVTALLEGVSRDPEVRRAEIIPPTQSAVERAAKRHKKLAGTGRRRKPSVAVPRVPENPHSGPTRGNTANAQVAPECWVSRQSEGPALSKKTVGIKKTDETRDALPDAVGHSDGGFARAGAREGAGVEDGTQGSGSAALQGVPSPRSPRQSPRPRTTRTRPRRMPAGYDEVRAAIPPRVARPGTELYVGLRRAIADLLTGNEAAGIPRRTPEQVIARINRRWYGQHADERCAPGYAPATDAEADRPIKNPSSWLAAAILAQDCPNPSCEDGILLDTGQACVACRERRAEEAAARRAAQKARELLDEQTAQAAQRTTARQAYEQAAQAAEKKVRQRLERAGLYGRMLDHHTRIEMARWRAEHPEPAEALGAASGAPL